VKTGQPVYFVTQALRLARTSPWLTTISVFTIAVALSLMGLFAMAFFNANEMIGDLGASLRISVYLDDDVGTPQIEALQMRIRAHPGVTALRAMTPQEDRQRNRRLLDPKLLDGLDEAAIPGQPVLELELDAALAARSDLDELMRWAQELEGVESVEDVQFGAEKLRLLFAIVEIVRTVGLVLSAVLMASAMFFVFVTIRLAVFSRRDEIEILHLVGATPRFIRLPFLLEGALQGLVGALVAMLFIGGLHLELRSLIRDFYMLNVGWSLLPPGMVLWLLIGGPAVGLLASGLSVGRYLKV
jgi:cell division transport system permease protein